MDISHRIMTKPMGNFMVATHNAISTNNQKEIDIAIDFLVELARTETLLDSIGRQEVKEKPNCNDDWGPKACCTNMSLQANTCKLYDYCNMVKR